MKIRTKEQLRKSLFGKPIRDERGIVSFEGRGSFPKDPIHSPERAGGLISGAQLKGRILIEPPASPRIPTRSLPTTKRPQGYQHDAIMKGKKKKVIKGKLA